MKKELLSKEKELEKIIVMLKNRIQEAPKGWLRIIHDDRGTFYYHCLGRKESGKGRKQASYIKKQDIHLARILAQKSYDKKVLMWAKECYEKLLALSQCYEDDRVDRFYQELSEDRRNLVTPLEDSVAGRIARWESIEYQGKRFLDNLPYIVTEKGERVRSKSEKILADKFLLHHIPYKYEMPLHLAGFGTIYPDFTLLDVHTGEVIYWEHFGMMDHPDYGEKAVKKMETYVRNGILPGKQLIITFETQKSGLDMRTVETLLEEYFL